MQRLMTLAAALCVATSPGAQQQAAPTSPAYTLRVSAERVAQCEAQGGCALVTRDELVQAISEAMDMAAKDAQSACRRSAYRT